MTSIITIANQKGGTGKTTTAITLAHGLALQGCRVLIVDLDPQGQAAVSLGLDPEPGVYNWIVRETPLQDVVRATGREKLVLLPGDKGTSRTINFLLAEYRGAVPMDLLLTLLQPLNGGLDYVVVDTAPSATELQAAAIYAARLVLIPARTAYLSEDAVSRTLDTIQAVNECAGHEPTEFAVLPTFYDQRTADGERALASYQAALPHNTLEPIHQATRIADASAAGKTIFEVEPKGRPATEYARLVWHVRDAYG